MGALQSFPEGVVERLTLLLRQAKSKTEYQRIQCVRLRALLGLSAPQIAQVLGWQAQLVRQLQSKYIRHGEAVLSDKPKGGRHHENLTLQQEQELLDPFLTQAQEGGVLVVAPVQAAYEQTVGHQVHPSVVYRALHRQGWRKLAPRPNPPKASEEAREAFKKSCPPWSRNK